jgi:hypothetical protein
MRFKDKNCTIINDKLLKNFRTVKKVSLDLVINWDEEYELKLFYNSDHDLDKDLKRLERF